MQETVGIPTADRIFRLVYIFKSHTVKCKYFHIWPRVEAGLAFYYFHIGRLRISILAIVRELV